MPSKSFRDLRRRRIAVCGHQTLFLSSSSPTERVFSRCCSSSSTTWRCSCNSSYWTPIRPSPIAGGLSSLSATWRAMDLVKLSSKVGRPVCLCVRFSIFILCCRPPSFSFLRVSRTLVCFHGRLMERFSLEVLVCGVVASCLSLFGFLGFFLGFTFWWRWSESWIWWCALLFGVL